MLETLVLIVTFGFPFLPIIGGFFAVQAFKKGEYKKGFWIVPIITISAAVLSLILIKPYCSGSSGFGCGIVNLVSSALTLGIGVLVELVLIPSYLMIKKKKTE